MVEQPIEDRSRDHGITEDLAPLRETFVGRQDDAAPLVACRYQGEEGCGRDAVARPHPEFIDDQNLGRQVDPKPAVQPVFSLGSAQVFQELMGADEIDSSAVLDGLESESHGKMGLAHPRWSEEQDVGCLSGEA